MAVFIDGNETTRKRVYWVKKKWFLEVDNAQDALAKSNEEKPTDIQVWQQIKKKRRYKNE